ncbi:MAG: DNA repair protein RecN [Clostridia bacterium]|nr:DNA repair protein RecN [Clostridia bacterium]
MLRELYIKNVAVIEDAGISFDGGLNVLTGETGAGKSIIIDSINMILGERTSKDYVRFNADKARVQAVFDADEKISELCAELGAEAEDETVILTREITAEGKSTARINGMVVPLSAMRTLASVLINIHGQHDNQALLMPSRHVEFLDEYAAAGEARGEYEKLYRRLKEVRGEILSLTAGEKEKAERADLLRYQIDEIDDADLTPGEEEELSGIRDEILNAERIADGAMRAYGLLYESEGTGCAYDAIASAICYLEPVSGYSSVLSDACAALNEASYTIEDAAHSIHDYADTVEFDKAALDETEQRLELIGKLKRKYGADIERILEYRSKAAEELEGLDNLDDTISRLEQEEKQLSEAIGKAAEHLSKVRKAAAAELENKITAALHELNMEHAAFGVSVEEAEPSASGADDIQFMIRTNGGEPMKPLTKIASGGELSRTMLALKSVLSDGVDTLIFDEIDTGVSGMAAKKIAVKLFEISVGKQVLCITHLPQLAAMADHHFLIEKTSDDNSARTSVRELDGDGRVVETARLTGGDITPASKNHASELLKSCAELKRGKKQ